MYGNDVKNLNDKQTTEIWVSRLKGRDGYILKDGQMKQKQIVLI